MRQGDDGFDDGAVRLTVETGHEHPVDLDRVERQVLEVRQGRVARPEVVEDDPDAHVAQAAQGPDPGLGLIHHDAFGDLELEHRRLEPGLGQDRLDLLDEVGLDELAGGDVHRHQQPRPARPRIPPFPCLATGRLEDPSAERQDESCLLGQRDEGERGDEATVGMLPADERLEPDDAIRFEVDERLVVEAEFASLDRPPQVVLHVDPVHRLGGHRWLEDHAADRWIPLRADHCDPGLAEHLAGCRATGSPDGDPECGADEPLATTHRERRTETGADPVGDAARVVGVEDRVEDDPELVPTEAGHSVPWTEAASEALADRDQQAIADGVTDALVDDLEPVEVKEDDGDRVRVPGVGRCERVSDPVGQELAIGEPRRRVVQGASLRRVEESRVVERDRGQLGETHEGVCLARSERAIERPRGQADDTDRRPA